MGKPLKLLFVNHAMTVGGSTRSLREVIRNYASIECDLVVPRDQQTMTEPEMRAYFGPNVRRIFRFWLPFELCYRGRAPLLSSGYRWVGLAALWWAQRRSFYRFVRSESYDAIHLNSVVLHPMIHPELPFIVHVREIVDLDLARVRRNVAAARGAIFIDEATRAPFRDMRLAHSMVLNNPVDMTEVGAPPRDAVARLGGDPEKLTIFSMLGLLIPEKGVARAIRAFRGTRDPQLRLVLVGHGSQEAELRRLALGDERIVFWGVVHDVVPLYALSDYVLRGEAYPCVGRTIYEALYAGCGVIIPGAETDHTLFEYERFRSRVHFYPPGDEARLRATFEQLAQRKVPNKVGGSNVAEHVRDFDRFVREVIGRTA